MSDDLVKALQKEAREDADEITRLRESNARLLSLIDGLNIVAEVREKDSTRLRAENERLRKALRPFARVVGDYRTSAPDHYTIDSHQFTLGQIRRAAAALEGATEPVSLWQHKKTGGIYEVVGECQVEATNTLGVLYRNTSTGVTWMRPKEEFFDGRFVEWSKPEPAL